MRRRRDRIRRAGRSRRENPRPPARFHRHLSSRWFRQKARSKAGSPYQAHSASRNTGPRGPIRMFFGLTSPWTSARRVRAVVCASRPSGAGEIGMRADRGDQIRLDAQRVKAVVGGEVARDRGIAGRRGVDQRQPLADRSRARRIGMAVAQQMFPDRIGGGIEIFHREHPVRLDPRRAAAAPPPGHIPPGDAEPGGFVMIADDRRLPELRDPEARQCALQAKPPARQFDQPDLRRHAAVERPALEPFARPAQPHAIERRPDRLPVERRTFQHAGRIRRDRLGFGGRFHGDRDDPAVGTDEW